jgi:hypothetical protein
MRWNGILLAAMFFLAGVISASNHGAAEKTAVAASAPANQTNIQLVLNQRFDLDMVEMPLKDVIAYLQRETGIQFVLSLKEMQDASVSPDSPITLRLKKVRLRTLLDLMFKDLELTFIEKDGLLVITTLEDEESFENLEIRVYDCRDLLAMPALQVPASADRQPPIPVQQPAIPAQQPASNNTEVPADRGRGVCGTNANIANIGPEPKRRVPETELERRTDQLTDLITNSIKQDSWDEVGGSGTITSFNGIFVVAQTTRIQDQVEQLFNLMRQAAGLESRAGQVVRK